MIVFLTFSANFWDVNATGLPFWLRVVTMAILQRASSSFITMNASSGSLQCHLFEEKLFCQNRDSNKEHSFETPVPLKIQKEINEATNKSFYKNDYFSNKKSTWWPDNLLYYIKIYRSPCITILMLLASIKSRSISQFSWKSAFDNNPLMHHSVNSPIELCNLNHLRCETLL